MTRWSVVWGVFVCAALASGCSGGPGPASPTFNPFGTDPASTGADDPVTTGNETPPPQTPAATSLPALCAQVCAHIASACPGAADPTCTDKCSAVDPMGCDAEVKAFFSCLVSAPLTCEGNNNVSAPTCMTSENAVSDCINNMIGAGGNSSGGGI
jgi:hypothetical protein